MEISIMNDREEAEFREQADGFFDNMDRDEMEDWFEGDAWWLVSLSLWLKKTKRSDDDQLDK